jgi:glycosyltransferase involved in cell wall biosynthesis
VEASCVLVGPTEGREGFAGTLQRRAARLGLERRVRLVGQCDDMPAALMLADIVVHASITPEAFGRVVIEAQAMRRLVIATDQGGPAETVEHGVTGWRVKPGDPAALAGALDHALALSPEGRDRIGEAAQVAVLQNYTTCAMQDATLHVYRELLG